MNLKFLRIFNLSAPVATDGLQQPQREAIVDLLNFCRLADDKLVVVEEETGAAVEAELHWESHQPLVSYAADSLARSERVLHDEKLRREFIQDVAERLNTTELKSRAIGICLDMFKADGEFAPQERDIFVEIRRAMGWPGGK
jgi:hypothetical protein